MHYTRKPAFVKRFGPPWHAVTQIEDLKTLKELSSECTLISFDIGGLVPNITEVGLVHVALSVEKPLLPPHKFDGHLRTFYHENAIQAHTIEVSVPSHHNEALKYGERCCVDSENASEALARILSTLNSTNAFILVGFNMYAEFQWISQAIFSMLSKFKYWVDVENLIEAKSSLRPKLMTMMAEMNIMDRRPELGLSSGRKHRASNDAVRILAVLSTLLNSESAYRYNHVRQPRFFTGSPNKLARNAFRARITAQDHGMLPPQIRTPRDLAAVFAAYELNAVSVAHRAQSTGVRAWWVYPSSEAMLDQIAMDVEGAFLYGKQLAVEKMIAPWVPRVPNPPKLD